MKNIDTLIHARWIATVNPDDELLENHSLAIDQGQIIALLPSEQAEQSYLAKSNHDLHEHLLMPGLINAHTHAAMTLLRGLADDLPLMDWLQNHIWPAESQWVGKEFVKDATELAIAEMLRGGTTCFNDMYFFPDVTARIAAAQGMRACVGMIIIDFPSAWAQDADEYFRKGIELHDEFRDHELIRTLMAPHAPYTVSDDNLKRVRMNADELDIPVHMHIHETAFEVSQSEELHGMRPLARLQQLGLINNSMLAVHMTQLNNDEIAMLAEAGVSIAHCPESNLKLASGFCPLDKLLKAGVNVALGTDGVASNNDQDMFGEMRTAGLLAKGVAADAAAAPVQQILRMATINGAKALGISHITGSLEIGKAADICALNLEDISTQPVYNPLSQLVYSANREQVSHVWVNGELQVEQGQLLNMDKSELIEKARRWRDKIATP